MQVEYTPLGLRPPKGLRHQAPTGCGNMGTFHKLNGEDHRKNLRIVSYIVTCFRQDGHIGPHRNGKKEWK